MKIVFDKSWQILAVFHLCKAVEEAPPEYIAKVPGLNGYQDTAKSCSMSAPKFLNKQCVC